MQTSITDYFSSSSSRTYPTPSPSPEPTPDVSGALREASIIYMGQAMRCSNTLHFTDAAGTCAHATHLTDAQLWNLFWELPEDALKGKHLILQLPIINNQLYHGRAIDMFAHVSKATIILGAEWQGNTSDHVTSNWKDIEKVKMALRLNQFFGYLSGITMFSNDYERDARTTFPALYHDYKPTWMLYRASAFGWPRPAWAGNGRAALDAPATCIDTIGGNDFFERHILFEPLPNGVDDELQFDHVLAAYRFDPECRAEGILTDYVVDDEVVDEWLCRLMSVPTSANGYSPGWHMQGDPQIKVEFAETIWVS